jgi:ABC-type branched-subunit amino acid transport system substrate-binding protein
MTNEVSQHLRQRRPVGRMTLYAVVVSFALVTATIGLSSVRPAGAATKSLNGTVKIGTIIDTDPTIGLASLIPGINAAVTVINQSGGINGKKLVDVFCAAIDPTSGAVTCPQKMVSAGVFADAEDTNILSGAAANTLLAANHIAQVGTIPASAQEYSAKNVFVPSGGTVGQYMSTFQLASSLKLTKAYVIASPVPTFAPLVSGLNQKAANYYHVKLLGTSQVSLTQVDFSSVVQAVKNSGANFVVLDLALQGVEQYAQTAEQLGVTAAMVTADGVLKPSQIKSLLQAGKAPIYTIAGTPPFTAKSAQMTALKGALTRDCKGGETAACPANVTSAAVQSYMAVLETATAARAVKGTLTASSFLSYMQKVKSITTGLVPPWSPTNFGPAPYVNFSLPISYFSKGQSNGELKPLNVKPNPATNVLAPLG